LKLDKLELASKEVFATLEKHLKALISLEEQLRNIPTGFETKNEIKKDEIKDIMKNVSDNFTAIDKILESYLFKKKDLQNLANKVKVPSFSEKVASLEKIFYGDYVCSPDYLGSKLSFSEIKISSSGKFQFISKNPIEGTSFAAPAIAVELAQKGNI